MFKIRMETAPFLLAPKAVFFITQWSSQLLHIITYTHIQKKKKPKQRKSPKHMNESNWGDENLYNENVRILKKEVREDIRQWKDLPCHWTGRINVTKMARLPKTIYIFSATSIKIHMSFFTELEKNNPRILMELLKTTKAIQRKPSWERTMLELSHCHPPNYTTTCFIYG